MPAPVTIYGYTGELIASSPKSPDSPDLAQDVRLAGRGEQYVENLFNGMHALAQEGSFYVAQTATPGTGITLTVATGVTFLNTQGVLGINNTDSGPFGKTIWLDSIRFICTTAPTVATSWTVAHTVDPTSTYRSTAGTALTARTAHSGLGSSSVAQVLAFPTFAAPSGSVRNMGRNLLRVGSAAFPLVGDDICIKFGSQEAAAGGNGINNTLVSAITVYAAPIGIAPGHSYVLNEWAPARTAAMSGEVIVTWFER
jgi:hypothetical protein